MATIYILQDKDDERPGNNSQGLSGVNDEISKNYSNPASLTTNQPATSDVHSTTTTAVKPHKSTMSVSRSVHVFTALRGSQSTGTPPSSVARHKTTSKTAGNFHLK